MADHPVLGVACKLLSVAFLSGMAAAVKYLAQQVPVGEIIFVRGIVSMIVLALLAYFTSGIGILRTRNLKGHAYRSIVGSVSMFLWFSALTLIPLADMTAISFTMPMFLTILAMLFLGERIHRYRWAALGIGLCGVLIMIGPLLSFSNGTGLGVAAGLTAALLGAFAQISLRYISGREHAITITFYFAATSTLFALVTALFGWPLPTAQQWLVLLVAAFLGVAGQLMMSFSYRYGEASMLAPLEYTSLVMAVAYGYFLFEEIPGIATFIGAPLVIVAGLLILWREYRLLSQARRAQRISARSVAESLHEH